MRLVQHAYRTARQVRTRKINVCNMFNEAGIGCSIGSHYADVRRRHLAESILQPHLYLVAYHWFVAKVHQRLRNGQLQANRRSLSATPG